MAKSNKNVIKNYDWLLAENKTMQKAIKKIRFVWRYFEHINRIESKLQFIQLAKSKEWVNIRYIYFPAQTIWL